MSTAFPKRRFGRLLAWFRERDFPRACFRGCSYFVMFRPPSLLASQIAPTAASNLAGQPRRFTSEQNVRRYLRTHRTCYPPDYRQLAERGLSPREIRSFVGCSLLFQAFPNAMRRLFAENRVDERYRDFSATYSDESGIGIEYRDRVEGVGRWE